MTNKYLEKIAEMEKAALGWDTVGRGIKRLGNAMGARVAPKVGPAPQKGLGDHVRSFGQDVLTGKGHARLAVGATGAALATGVLAGRASKSDG